MAQSTAADGCLTHFKTGGTFYDFGFSVGAHFRQRIQLYFNESDHHQKTALPFYESQEGRDYYEESLRACQDCFPHYVQEVRGMANGAGLPFEHVFMANISESQIGSLLKLEAPAQSQHTASECGCSTIFISSQETRLILHTEDNYPLLKKYGYLVSADIQDGDRTEKFTAFCHPGALPGRAFSVNHRGLAFSSNVLCPAYTARGSPSRLFLLRAMVAVRTTDQAVKQARNEPYGSAYGFTVNLATAEGDMASLEVGPGKPRAAVHVHEISQPSGPDSAASHYYHSNAYQHLKVPELGGKLQSSIRRAQRVRELPPPRRLRQALDIAADTHDPEFPIFRTPRPTDPAQMVCTAVFDVLNNEMRVYGDRDGLLSDTPAVKLPLFL
ncbi:beta-alanyl-dopamine/carcinine hydrolase-like [Babylonia areolata]|uniref:beta-alanyl-dopamine/carcinine hydrolase-like n=1 Tax=Babylonia areolata TaxID=304850 RepID=UPI003FD4D634